MKIFSLDWLWYCNLTCPVKLREINWKKFLLLDFVWAVALIWPSDNMYVGRRVFRWPCIKLEKTDIWFRVSYLWSSSTHTQSIDQSVPCLPPGERSKQSPSDITQGNKNTWKKSGVSSEKITWFLIFKKLKNSFYKQKEVLFEFPWWSDHLGSRKSCRCRSMSGVAPSVKDLGVHTPSVQCGIQEPQLVSTRCPLIQRNKSKTFWSG